VAAAAATVATCVMPAVCRNHTVVGVQLFCHWPSRQPGWILHGNCTAPRKFAKWL
jgi:hypothetical protein